MSFIFGDAPTVSAPKSRDYLGEMSSALNAQGGIQNNLLNLERQYTPQYQQLQQQSLMGQMGVLGNLYGQAIPQSQALQSQMLASQGQVYGQVGKQALNAYRGGMDAGTMGLYNTMQQKVQAGLDAGYGLTPEMQAQAQQSARAAMTARGLTGSGQGVAQEVLNSYNLGQNRYQNSLANASAVYGLGVQQNAQANAMYGQPLMTQLGGVSAGGLINGAQAGYNALGAKLFQPESQYNAQLIGANQSNEMQTNMANAQIQASHQAAGMGMLGAIGGSLLGAAGMAGGFGNLFGAGASTGAELSASTVGGINAGMQAWTPSYSSPLFSGVKYK